MDTPDTILFAVTHKPKIARVGLPPHHVDDNFNARSLVIGKMYDATKITFSPEGDLFAVRGPNLFRGPMPSDPKKDWFPTAKMVGTVDWNKFKFLFFFDPNGLLYAVTKNGEFYKGPAPDNENMSWLYRQATKIGQGTWDTFHALFFDNKGILYAVTNNGTLVMRSPPTRVGDDWLGTSTTIGIGDWRPLCHFIDFSPDDYLWCVNKNNGKIYKGLPPTAADPGSYLKNAEYLGYNYNTYRFLAFSIDKTIQSIGSFEFLPDSGEILSQGIEVLQSQIYTNTSSSTLKHSFSFSKTLTETSTFTQEHGFTVSYGSETTFSAGIPFISKTETKISVNTSTTHTWSLTKTNTTETTFSSSTDVEVPAGRNIRMVATVLKGEMNVPYRAKIQTLFGYETIIQGMWKGVTHYNLTVSQEDYKP
ncbi:Hypothetical predicted protein [Pelobates cultripes]|uniref:Tachylectin 2 domain-containing protein n=1 Tax=Pelobates cultripes TaxID=61616 RepID=A0AAD1SFG6_PELCU|nr:Hypothetical predicted protein [Pelobates cultripes]